MRRHAVPLVQPFHSGVASAENAFGLFPAVGFRRLAAHADDAEAASRGAASVSMIEQDALAYSVLQNSAKTLKAECVQLVRGDALKFARSAGRTYDLIFLDPPYRMGWIEKITPLLPALLKEGGQVYVEAEYDIEHIDQLTRIKHGKAGQVFYHLFATCA